MIKWMHTHVRLKGTASQQDVQLSEAYHVVNFLPPYGSGSDAFDASRARYT